LRGVPVKLAPQPFRILALLASRAGEPVTREEIRREVWGEETYVDFERGLNFAISQIRAALEDDAQSPRYIQTLPRRGYRFIAPVETEEARTPEETPQPVPSSPARLSLWGLVALLGIALVVAFVAWRRRDAPPVLEGPRLMVAVLPFEDLSAGPPQAYWSDALTGELITQLGRLRPERLGVIARTSVMTYKGVRRDAGEIAGELGVDYLLEGSVRRSGESVRITAQLIQARDGTQLWAETYERDRRGAFDVQAQVGAEVARALALELLPDMADRARAANPEAWDAYLQGRYLANRGGKDLARSLGPLERAIARDPGFAPAHAALADVFHGLVMSGALPPRDGYLRAKAAARQAVALDPGLAEAHAVLAAVHFWYDWDWPAAERSFRRALELNPSLSAAHHDYGFFLIARGRAGEGLAEVERARRLDPLSPRANIDVGWAYISARRYDDAIAQSRRTLELEPGFPEAEACLEQARRMKGEDPEGTRDLDRQRARRIEEAVARGERVSPIRAAGVYASLGDRDRAFAWLDRALAERSPMLALLAVHPSWDNLRPDPRFEKLLERIRPA
jgi:TolB-like protein/DNA-binding winged helix-turn-helix (wHTH) protein/Tfp pilus assembly protein PilF